MASLNDQQYITDVSRTVKKKDIRRPNRFFANRRVLGRCYVSTLLGFFFIFYSVKLQNISENMNSAQHEHDLFYSAVVNWTPGDFTTLYYGFNASQICLQFLGALLIYKISSHRYLTAAVVVSSILHIVTPLAAYSSLLVFILVAQMLVEAPFRIAVLSMWKDLSPPGKRTIFVFLSYCSWILIFPFSYLLFFLGKFHLTKEIFYITGACGLGWSLVWFFTAPDSLSEDIQGDQVNLQNDTHSAVKWRSKLSNVPWKSIATSKPVIALCVIYFKIGSSFSIFIAMTAAFFKRMQLVDPNYSPMPYLIIYTLVITISAVVTDILSRKSPKMLKVRKGILSGAVIIHSIVLYGILFPNMLVKTNCFFISYIILSLTLPGFLTNPLDLSSRFVTIISGFTQTFYYLGLHSSAYSLVKYFDDLEKQTEDKDILPLIVIFEMIYSIVVGIVFQVWGSVEEQSWSLNIYENQESTNVEEYTFEVNEI